MEEWSEHAQARRPVRSRLDLNHWLIARTGDEVVAREVFDRFKRFADSDAGAPMRDLVDQIARASRLYRQFVSAAAAYTGPIDRLGLFGYRTGVLESEVIKPLVLCLLDPEQPAVPDVQLAKALDVVESWMVRRMLVRATTKNYNQVVSELVAQIRKSDRSVAGDVIERYLAAQSSASRYWPDDAEVREELESLLAYRRLGRGRLRMILEAVEDYKRGWRDGKTALSEERVARGKYAIEHIMPRKWTLHWPLKDSAVETDRDRLIHTLGNLTLLTGRLNSKVSNGPWIGDNGKREGLADHDVLLLNRDLVKIEGDWTDRSIRQRTTELANIVTKIWPVPAGHKSPVSEKPRTHHRKVQLLDLLSAGLLAPGMPLFPRRKKFADRTATLLGDGQIEIDGIPHDSPRFAASKIAGRPTNGWWFFLVQQNPPRSLRDVRRAYVDSSAIDTAYDDADDADSEDDDDDDEA